MKTRSFLPIALGLFLLNCSDADMNGIGHDLFQTNHSLGGFYSRYHYANDRLDRITFHGDGGDWQYTYLQVTYLNENSSTISLVEYNPESTDYIIKDTLIYTDRNISHIIRTVIEDKVINQSDTTFFNYDEQFNLIEARLNNKKLTFSNYQDGNFGNVKQYNYDQLFVDIALKYDNGKSPFSELGYLNLVIFNDNFLEGFQYLTDKNIIEWTEIEYQGITMTNTYKNKIQYDFLTRTKFATLAKVGDTEFKMNSYYKYK